MSYKVIDNFLEKEEFLKLKEFVKSDYFPWFFQNEINNNHINRDDFYFTHILYIDNKVNSPFYEKFSILLKKINCKALIRLKANFYTKTKKVQIHEPHKDYDFKHNGCIFSFNTCDGYTLLKDGTKINSIENRILFFDPSIEHSSTSCTNDKGRLNVNINYF